MTWLCVCVCVCVCVWFYKKHYLTWLCVVCGGVLCFQPKNIHLYVIFVLCYLVNIFIKLHIFLYFGAILWLLFFFFSNFVCTFLPSFCSNMVLCDSYFMSSLLRLSLLFLSLFFVYEFKLFSTLTYRTNRLSASATTLQLTSILDFVIFWNSNFRKTNCNFFLIFEKRCDFCEKSEVF